MANEFSENEELVIPDELPLLPIRDVVVYPYMILPLFVGREPSIRAVNEALAKDRLIFLAAQKEITDENPSPDTIYTIGTVAMIMRMRKLPDGRVKILVQGLMKGTVLNYTQEKPFFVAHIKQIKEKPATRENVEVEALMRTVKEQLEKVISLGRVLSPDILMVLDDINEAGRLADLVASNLGLKVTEAQEILELFDPAERLKKVNEILVKELEVLAMQARIRSQAKDEMTKSQSEYFLREQIRAIKNELGDTESKSEEIQELRDKIAACKMPPEVQEEALKQLGRLERMHPDASEASMVRTYIDWLIDIPWSKATDDNLDLTRSAADPRRGSLRSEKDQRAHPRVPRRPQAEGQDERPDPLLRRPSGRRQDEARQIDRARHGPRIRAHLARRREGRGRNPRPPPHLRRRDARPHHPGPEAGRLRQPGLRARRDRQARGDFRGDPSAALLEVLDPEQNNTFRDHYLNVPFDLSNVMFIATANLMDTIPSALRDRMEVIQLAGYSRRRSSRSRNSS